MSIDVPLPERHGSRSRLLRVCLTCFGFAIIGVALVALTNRVVIWSSSTPIVAARAIRWVGRMQPISEDPTTRTPWGLERVAASATFPLTPVTLRRRSI